MTEQTRIADQGASDARPDQGGAEVTTEGSARVLNEVKGRLERIETGELPVIEKVGADGSSRRVDPTGEMIRPEPAAVDAARLAAVNEAAEAFASEHRAAAEEPPAPAVPAAPVADDEGHGKTRGRTGLWAWIRALFGRG